MIFVAGHGESYSRLRTR